MIMTLNSIAIKTIDFLYPPTGGLEQYDLHDSEQSQQQSPTGYVDTAQLQRPPSRSYERSSPPRSSSRNESQLYESPIRRPYSRSGSGEQSLGQSTVGDKYPAEQPRSPEKRASPIKQGRNLSRQPSLQRLSPQQSEQEVLAFRRGNEAGAAFMEQPQQQPTSYGQGSYGANETTPMESAYGGGPGPDDGYQYDANSTFANYDVDPAAQNYTADGMQYGDQQPLYDDQYRADEYYQPQQQSANAYMDNDGSQQQYQPQYEATPAEYKYQPEPEYEYKPYQGRQSGTATPAAANPITQPSVVASQQPKPSYSEPNKQPTKQPTATTPAQRTPLAAEPPPTTTAITAPTPRGGPTSRPTAGGAAKSNRTVPQSRAPTTSTSAALSSDRK